MSVRLIRSVLFTSIAAAVSGVQAAPSHWVRVESTATRLQQVLGPRAAAADYGRFQWLAVDASDVARLQAAGLPVTEVDAPFVLDLGGERFDPREAEPRIGG